MVLCKRLHPDVQYFDGNVDKRFVPFHYLCRRKAASQHKAQVNLAFCIRFAFSLHTKLE